MTLKSDGMKSVKPIKPRHPTPGERLRPKNVSGPGWQRFSKPYLQLLTAVTIMLTGCDTVNVKQYKISGAALSTNDVERVKAVLATVAQKTQLQDRTPQSIAPRTVVFYEEPNVEHFAVQLGARELSRDIVVDLYAGFGPCPPKFKQAMRLLEPALDSEFGPQYSLVEHPDTISSSHR